MQNYNVSPRLTFFCGPTGTIIVLSHSIFLCTVVSEDHRQIAKIGTSESLLLRRSLNPLSRSHVSFLSLSLSLFSLSRSLSTSFISRLLKFRRNKF